MDEQPLLVVSDCPASVSSVVYEEPPSVENESVYDADVVSLH